MEAYAIIEVLWDGSEYEQGVFSDIHAAQEALHELHHQNPSADYHIRTVRMFED